MKRFTLIALVAFAANAATAYAQQTLNRRIHTAPVSATASFKSCKATTRTAPPAPKRAASGTAWLPKAQNEYTYMNGRWVKTGTYTFTYDQLGREICIDNNDGDGILRTEKTYTDDGRLATETTSRSEDDGATFTPSEKKEQTYDPLFPQLTLTKDKYIWLNNAWQPNYDSFHRTVVRNADNNVTSLTLAVPYNSIFEETHRITNTFNAQTKKAETFQLEELNQSGGWSRTQYLRNLVWQETNGQLVDQYDLWMSYGNKLLSGTIADNDPQTGDMTDFGFISIDYSADGNDYVETINYTDVLSRSVTSLETTDDNGSYTYIYKYYEDTNGDGKLDTTEVTEYNREDELYDAHGNMKLYAQYALNDSTGKEELAGATRYEYSYDATHGDATKELTISEYSYDTKKYTPILKISTTEYTTTTSGIRPANTNHNNTTETMVYNLQGMKINKPSDKGIYIVKRNGKLLKVTR